MGESPNLIQFLKESSITLTREGVVYHPCFVAITEYSITKNTNRYCVTFGDWQDHFFHYAFPRKEWKHRYDSFISHVREVRRKHPQVVGVDWDTTTSWGHCDVLVLVDKHLKRLHFHNPFTGTIFEEAIKGHTDRGCKVLPQLTSWDAAERMNAEQTAGALGEWDYGILLEEFYLAHPDDQCPYYAELFFQDNTRSRVFALTAFCPNMDKGRQALKMLSIPEVPSFGYEVLDIESFHQVLDKRGAESLRQHLLSKLSIPRNDAKYKALEHLLAWLRNEATYDNLRYIVETLHLNDSDQQISHRHWPAAVQPIYEAANPR